MVIILHVIIVFQMMTKIIVLNIISVDQPSCCEKMCVLVSDPGNLKEKYDIHLFCLCLHIC